MARLHSIINLAASTAVENAKARARIRNFAPCRNLLSRASFLTMSFSFEPQGGVAVALIIDIDKTGAEGPNNGKIIYLHKPDCGAVDDIPDRSETKFKETREEPEFPRASGGGGSSAGVRNPAASQSARDGKKRKREQKEFLCPDCGGPQKLHSPDGDCPDEKSVYEWEQTQNKDADDYPPPPPSDRLIHDSKGLTPYRAVGGSDYFDDTRESRTLRRQELEQLEKARGDAPEFIADPRRRSYMQKLYDISQAQQKAEKGGKSVTLTNSGIFRIMPPKYRREVMMVVGQQGAGKSWICGRYARLWKEAQQRRYEKGERTEPKVYLFSAKMQDDELDKVGVKRVVLDKSFLEAEPDVADYAQQLVIFDDVDQLIDTKVKRAVNQLCDQILGIGRSINGKETNGIWCIRTSHMFFNWNATRASLLEANKVVWFPDRGSGKQGIEWLKKHAKLDKAQLSRVAKIKSRWLVYDLTSPNYVLSETQLFLV